MPRRDMPGSASRTIRGFHSAGFMVLEETLDAKEQELNKAQQGVHRVLNSLKGV